MIGQTIFANVLVTKISDTEIIFEFGAYFSNVPGESGLPATYQPDIRVVLPMGLLDGLVEHLNKMQRDRAAVKAVESEKKA